MKHTRYISCFHVPDKIALFFKALCFYVKHMGIMNTTLGKAMSAAFPERRAALCVLFFQVLSDPNNTDRTFQDARRLSSAPRLAADTDTLHSVHSEDTKNRSRPMCIYLSC